MSEYKIVTGLNFPLCAPWCEQWRWETKNLLGWKYGDNSWAICCSVLEALHRSIPTGLVLVHLLGVALLHFGVVFLAGDKFRYESPYILSLVAIWKNWGPNQKHVSNKSRYIFRVNASKPPHIVRVASTAWANKILYRVVVVPDLCPGLSPVRFLARHGGQTFLSRHSSVTASTVHLTASADFTGLTAQKSAFTSCFPLLHFGLPHPPILCFPLKWRSKTQSATSVCVCLCIHVNMKHAMYSICM